MKTFSVLAISILLFSSCSKNNVSPIIQIPLANADMESGTTQPSSWFNSNTNTEIAMTWTTAESSSASHSLEISRSTVTDVNSYASWGHSYQGAMPVGKDLTLNVKIKGDNLVGQGVSIVIRVDGATPDLQFSTTQGSEIIAGTFDWKTYTVKLTGLSSQGKFILVYLVYLPSTTGKAYFDDVSLSHN